MYCPAKLPAAAPIAVPTTIPIASPAGPPSQPISESIEAPSSAPLSQPAALPAAVVASAIGPAPDTKSISAVVNQRPGFWLARLGNIGEALSRQLVLGVEQALFCEDWRRIAAQVCGLNRYADRKVSHPATLGCLSLAAALYPFHRSRGYGYQQKHRDHWHKCGILRADKGDTPTDDERDGKDHGVFSIEPHRLSSRGLMGGKAKLVGGVGAYATRRPLSESDR